MKVYGKRNRTTRRANGMESRKSVACGAPDHGRLERRGSTGILDEPQPVRRGSSDSSESR
jgi:hypothetical protein